jgi:beta-glucosidase
MSANAISAGKSRLSVGADVRNTGSRDGTETVQLYIRLRGTSVARPVRELKGFRRVQIAAGQSQRIQFSLGREELAFWNIDMKDIVEPCSLYVWIAPDSARGTPARVEITQ